MIFKKDNIYFGLIIGLIAPIAGFVIFKQLKLNSYNWAEVLKFLFSDQSGRHLLTVAISFSLVANAFFFTLFINAHIDKTAKGIFIATLIYALVTLTLKFLI